MKDPKRIEIRGRACALRGGDIDTDRICPARFLKTVTFEGLGENAFFDDREQMRASGRIHPFDQESFTGAALLVVNRNFGCGSSREHAAQALMRRGFEAVIGESFAEIFFGNCLAIGVPCATIEAAAIEEVQALVEARPQTEFLLNIEAKTLKTENKSWPLSIPDGPRSLFLSGAWDSTAELYSALDQVKKHVAATPYMRAYEKA